MIKYVLPAAVAAVALAAPAVSHAQVQPMPPPVAAYPAANVNVNATITGQPQPGAYEATQGYAEPAPGYVIQPGFSPRTTWIPGHYDWDPATSNYRYIDGQFVEAPRVNAQWFPGHWVQTPTAMPTTARSTA